MRRRSGCSPVACRRHSCTFRRDRVWRRARGRLTGGAVPKVKGRPGSRGGSRLLWCQAGSKLGVNCSSEQRKMQPALQITLVFSLIFNHIYICSVFVPYFQMCTVQLSISTADKKKWEIVTQLSSLFEKFCFLNLFFPLFYAQEFCNSIQEALSHLHHKKKSPTSTDMFGLYYLYFCYCSRVSHRGSPVCKGLWWSSAPWTAGSQPWTLTTRAGSSGTWMLTPGAWCPPVSASLRWDTHHLMYDTHVYTSPGGVEQVGHMLLWWNKK